MASARYAIYLAPPPDTPLWAFGSRVLGYDAVTGRDIFGFAPDGLNPAEWRRMTERPRTYGFHATLKAPFHLSAGMSERELENELLAFCRAWAPFDLGPLAPTAITHGESGFVALTMMRTSPELVELEHLAVQRFDRFRAPLTDADLRKRRPDMLTARQRDALLRFGYPYVGPDYRFHMTLSGEIPDAAIAADKLADAIANDIGTTQLRVDALVLFVQAKAGERFRVARRFDLSAVRPRSQSEAAYP